MIHAVKIYPEYYESVKSGEKLFEVRKNDRDYKVGDLLALNEFNPDDKVAGEYTGRAIIAKISYVLENPKLCKFGFVVLGLTPCKITDGSSESGLFGKLGLSINEFTEVTRK